MRYKLLRHAAAVIELGAVRLLTDPMLAPKSTMAPVEASPKMRPNPLVDLPLTDEGLNELLAGIDGVLVTHTHRDHFDDEAARRIPKELPLFCQPEDMEKLRGYGFSDVNPVEDTLVWRNIRITRTGGRHGSAVMGPKLGTVSGFVLEAKGEPKVYIAGDTVFCGEVKQALAEHQPQIVVANAGAARFLVGGRITMSVCDIERTARQLPDAAVIAVHMEAFNHCLLTREKLREFTNRKGLSGRVLIPEDGEQLIIEN